MLMESGLILCLTLFDLVIVDGLRVKTFRHFFKAHDTMTMEQTSYHGNFWDIHWQVCATERFVFTLLDGVLNVLSADIQSTAAVARRDHFITSACFGLHHYMRFAGFC